MRNGGAGTVSFVCLKPLIVQSMILKDNQRVDLTEVKVPLR